MLITISSICFWLNLLQSYNIHTPLENKYFWCRNIVYK
uniref:Uncharacterized protein n=1 Tax=Siphoviridae sp. ct9lR64 TaxID=2826178 RepID=A0A8S5QXD3_9CAUD|nr:MAG TPA: hypothetical protein [Siphoviridae sp. ct9lR64]